MLLSFSCSVVSDALQTYGLHHTRLLCPSLSSRIFSNSRPLARWCHPTISSSVAPFSSCSQSLVLGSFPMSWFFTSGGQSIGVSALASVLPMNIQDWFPLGWTGWISLLPKELSRVISSTTVQKHQFFWRLFTGFNNSMALCSSDTLFPKYPSQSFAVGALLSGSYDGKIRVLMIRAMFIMF